MIVEELLLNQLLMTWKSRVKKDQLLMTMSEIVFTVIGLTQFWWTWKKNIKKLHRRRKRLDATASVVTSAAPAAEAVTRPTSSPANSKTIKNIVLVPYAPKPKVWGSWQVDTSF